MDLQTIEYKGSKIRIREIEGTLYFVANDLAGITEHKNINLIINRNLDDFERKTMLFNDSIGRLTEHLVINETGFYKLMFRSNLPKAKEFTHYVASEILPQIRKTGTFGNAKLSENVNRLSEHRQNLKSLKIQSFELNKKIRNEKMKIEDIELIIFSNSETSTLRSSNQTDLFSSENKLLE